MHARVYAMVILAAGSMSACRREAIGPRVEAETASPAQPAPPPMPEQPSAAVAGEMQRIVRTLSRLSPENTLAHLPRSDVPPADDPKSLTGVPIETWSQPGIADGYMRTLQYDPASNHFWILETGGFEGFVHWFGPLVLDDNDSIQIAPTSD